LTYALYAVLVHSGGSYGGHYFAYISDGSNWYRFDDSTVTKVKREEIRKYGVNSNASFGTNAYLLFYRDAKTFRGVENIEIPIELLEKVKLD
jgi:ubiquitin C-terminal hydrolase